MIISRKEGVNLKRRLSQSGYEFLKTELSHLESTGNLKEGQSKELMGLYDSPRSQIKSSRIKMNSVQILTLIGGILIGLGILSFVASNWSELTKLTKFSILLATLVVFYLMAFSLEKKNPYLSKAFYYIGAFAYGAEIFYIGQMFHLGGNIEDAFLMWGIGIFPLAMYLKDNLLKGVSILFVYTFIEFKFLLAEGALVYGAILIIPILFAFGYYIMKNNHYILVVNFILLYQFIEMNVMFTENWIGYLPIVVIPVLFALNHFVMNNTKELMILNFFLLYQFIEMKFVLKPLEQEQFPYVALLLLPLLFYIGHKLMNKSKPLFIINFFFALQLTAYLFYYFKFENLTIIALFYFTLWMVLTYFQHPDYRKFMKFVGTFMHFPTALILSFPITWYMLFYEDVQFYENAPDSNALIASIVFSILYLIYALSLVKSENLYGIAIVSIFVLRFYVDLSLAFMDKSIAFIIGGILLLSLGYWFEKTRRREMGKNEELIK